MELVPGIGVFAGRPNVKIVIVDVSLPRTRSQWPIIETDLEQNADFGKALWHAPPQFLEVLFNIALEVDPPAGAWLFVAHEDKVCVAEVEGFFTDACQGVPDLMIRVDGQVAGIKDDDNELEILL